MLLILFNCMTPVYFFKFFFKSFWRTHVLFWGPWYPCFGFLVTSPLGFKARVGCLIRIAEANVMYVPRDPPLVLHLSTSWGPAHSRSCPHILLQWWGCRDSNLCSQNICEPEALPTELNRNQFTYIPGKNKIPSLLPLLASSVAKLSVIMTRVLVINHQS